MPVTEPFNIKRPLVAARPFTFAGVRYDKGDRFNPKDFSLRLVKRQYETGALRHPKDDEPEAEAPADADPVQMKPAPKNGYYVITAPWLPPEGETVRGKVNAEKRLAELREAGPPPEDAAALAARLKAEAGGDKQLEPVEGPAASVLVSVEEGGKFALNYPWGKTEIFDNPDDAAKRQTEVREAGPPEGWTPAPNE